MLIYKELITKIAENKEYLALCRKITGGNQLYKDLFQEALIVLLEYDKQKIINLYRQGQIKYFLTKIFINLYKKEHGLFYKQYPRNEFPINGTRIIEDEECYDLERDKEIEKKCALINQELKIENDDDPLWYDKKIFLEYLEKGSIKKLAEDTKIKYQSINTTIRKVRDRIKKKYEQA